MARSRPRRKVRLKPIAYAVVALVAGLVLLVLSQLVEPAPRPETAPTASAPGEPAVPEPSPTGKEATAMNLSGLLLLFGAAGFLICIICIGWFVLEVRKARPAWKTQKKYPKMR